MGGEASSDPRQRRGRRRRRRWPWLLGCAAVALLAAHLPSVQGLIRDALARRVSTATGADVALDELSYRLWLGEARLGGVRLDRPGLTVAAERVEVRLASFSSIAVDVAGLEVTVMSSGQEEASGPRGGGGRFSWPRLDWLAALRVSDGRVALSRDGAEPWLVLEPLELEAEGGGADGLRARLRLGGGSVALSEGVAPIAPLSAETDLLLRPEGLRVEGLRLGAGASRLSGEATLTRPSPLEASLDASVEADAAEVASALGLAARGRLAGEASLDARGKEGLGGMASLRAEGVGVAGLGPMDGDLTVELDRSEARIEIPDLEAWGGRLDVGARLGGGGGAVEVRRTDVEVAALIESTAGVDLPLAARGDVRARLRLEGWHLADAVAEGLVRLRPTRGRGLPVGGAVELGLESGALLLRAEGLRAHGARLDAEARLAEGTSSGRFRLDLPDLARLESLLESAGLPGPPFALAGGLALDGRFEGARVEASVSGRARGPAGPDFDVAGNLVLENSELRLGDVELRSGSGSARIEGVVPLGDGEMDLRASLAGLELAPAAEEGFAAGVRVEGELFARGPTADPVWGGELEAKRPAEVHRMPGAVSIAVAGRGSQLLVRSFSLALAEGRASGDAEFDLDTGALKLHATGSGLVLEALAPGDPSGTLSFDADLAGTTAVPTGELTFALEGATLRRVALPVLRGRIRGDPRHARLDLRGGESPLLAGRLEWETRDLGLSLDLAALPLERLAEWFEQGSGLPPLELELAGELEVGLPGLDADGMRFAARVDSLAATASGRTLRAVPFRVTGDRSAAVVEDLRIEAQAGWLSLDGRFGLAADAPMDLRLSSDLELASLAPFVPLEELAGALRADLTVGGSLAAPRPTGELRLAGGRVAVGPVRLDGLGVRVGAEGPRLRIEELEAELLGGRLEGSGDLALGSQRSETDGVDLLLRGLDLAPLLAPGASGTQVRVDLDARLRAAGRGWGDLRGSGRVERLDIVADAADAALESPASWQLQGGELKLEPVRLRGAGTDLRLSIGVPAGSGGPRLEAEGVVDIALSRLLLPDVHASGPLELSLRLETGPDGLELEGRGRLSEARLSVPAADLAVTQVGGELRFSERVIETSGLRGRDGDGDLELEGTLSLAGITDLGTSLRLTARRFPLTQIDGIRGRLAGELKLGGDGQRAELSGQLQLSGGHVDRETDAAQQSLDSMGRQLAQLDDERSLADEVDVDVQLRTSGDVRVANSLAELDVAGTLGLGGTLSAIDVSGSLGLRPGGRLRVGRALVRVESGRVDLAGYPADDIRIELRGSARVSGVGIDIAVQGRMDDLDVQLSSPGRSDLTQGDLATLLMTGRTARAAASESNAIVAEELAVALGGAIQDRLGGALRIDVSTDQSFAFDDVDPATRFSVSRPIGRDLAVAYSTALDGTGQRWLVSYEPGTGRLRLRLISEVDSSQSVEVTHRTSFGLGRERTERAPAVVSVALTGAGLETDAELLELVRKHQGRSFDNWRAGETAERIRERLVDRGFPGAEADFETRERSPDEVELLYRVDPGPRVELTWAGDPVGADVRKRIESLWRPGAAPDSTPGLLAREAKWALQAQGWYGALVEAETERVADDWRVALRVRRGPRGRRAALELEGAEAGLASELRQRLPRTDSPEFFEGLEQEGSRLRVAIRGYYAAEGFLEARVSAPVVAWHASDETLRVRVAIDEGPRATLVGLDLPPEAADAEGRDAPDLALRPGTPFRLDDFVADRAALAAFYRRRGHLEPRVEASLQPAEGGVRVTFQVEPGPRVRVGEIRIAEGARIRPGVVRDALILGEGDLISPAALGGSRRRLTDNRVMRSAELRTLPTSDPGVRDLQVELIERPELELSYGLRHTTEGRGGIGEVPSSQIGGTTQLSAQLEWLNPFGRMHRFSAFTYLALERQLVGGTFEAPFTFGRELLTQLFVFQDHRSETEVVELDASRIRTFTFQQTRRWRDELDLSRWNDALRLQWGYSFSRIQLTPMAGFAQPLDTDRARVYVSLVGDDRDSFTNPTRGTFWSVSPQLNHRILGSDVNFVGLYGQLFAFVPLGGRVVWASGYRFGVIPGDNPLLLLQDRFRAGGASTVRGVDQDGLGPRLPSGTPLGGQAMAVFNQELRFPIWKSIHGGVFWDAGQVFETAGDLDFRELRHSAGAGLRVILPIGPVRLDWAWLLDPQPGEARSRFWFTLGHAF